MSYPGGKNGAGVFQRLINLMPPHTVYIEPFLGGGAILRNKKPAAQNIGVDLDAALIKKWQRKRGFALARSGDAAAAFSFQCADGIEFLNRYPFTGQELVYCDPPYVHATRSRRKIYRHEMTDEDHTRLLKTLRRLPCPVIISGYSCDLYRSALADWTHETFRAMTRGGPRIESIWYNFTPARLHDYTHLGETFRDRERIKRKKARWVARLRRTPEDERQALIEAIAEVFDLVPSPK